MTASPEPAAHDEQLHAVIAEYHRRLDRGEAPDRAAFIAEHGEFQAELESYFQSVDSVERLAGPALQTAHAGDATEATMLTQPGRTIEEIVATPAPAQSPLDSAAKSDTQSVVAGETIITTMDEGTVSAISGLAGGKAAAPLQRFGRYRIVKELGRGAMGAVYLAHDEQLDREVALKIPQFGQDLNRGLLERFYREARAAAALRHPGICPVYDVGEIDGQHYITMAYIKGRALRDFTKSSKRQDGKQVARVIRKIALAMEEAHEHNVIHRDLKPANVMIDLKNEPVVMDFGLARRSVEGEERLTHTGTIIGTPAYMSPEQVDGDNDNVGARSDVYSLGVIFYELLTGQLPFQGNLMSILRQIATADPRPPVELFPDIDPALQSLCLKMLARKAADRPASMAEVAQSLSDWLSGRHAPTDESGLLETSRVPGQSRKHAAGEVTEPMTPAGTVQAESAAEKLPAAEDMSVTRQRSRPAARREGPPSSRGWLQFGSLGGAALLLAGIVFFLKLGKHDVQITLDDPAMSLKVDGDAVIIDGNGSPIRLSAGAHELRVELAGFESEVAQFTVKKDGKNAVHVAIVNGKLAVIPDGKAAHPATSVADTVKPGAGTATSERAPPQSGFGTAPPAAIAPFDAQQARAHQEAWARHLGTDVVKVNSIGMQMTLIPPGEFLMGSTDEQVEAALRLAEQFNVPPNDRDSILRAERPQHRVVITRPFRIGSTEVTLRQFKKFVARTGYQTDSEKQNLKARAAQPLAVPVPTYLAPDHDVTDDSPVAALSWNDAVAYCKWLSSEEQGKYRLPTEAEWEYACRAGATTQYSFGDDVGALEQHGWYRTNSGGEAHAVGMKPPNGFGLFDMHGNLWEWCHDYWDVSWYQKSPLNDPLGPADSSHRMMRGGCWIVSATHCRSTHRNMNSPTTGLKTFGIRVVQELEASAKTASVTPFSPPAVTSPPEANSVGPAPPLAKAPFDDAQAKAHQEAWAKHLGTTVVKPNSIGMQMTLIPPGEFLMGSSDEDIKLALKIAEETKLDLGGMKRIQDEQPQHRVRITQPFRLAAHEVTIGQFAKFIEQAKYKTQAEEFGGNSATTKPEEVKPDSLKLRWRTPGPAVTDDSPVTQVSWNDAVAFCNWLSSQEQLTPCYQRDGDSWTLLPKSNGYRLPTEAEWEYGCRAGTTTQYWFGDNWQEHDKYGWSNKIAGNRPHAVGSLPANPFGLHDMHGNVWEWCQDWYDGKWYEKSPSDDPVGPSSASHRVVLGGGWGSVPAYGRSSCRSGNSTPSSRNNDRGFRPALSSVGATTSVTAASQPVSPTSSAGRNTPRFTNTLGMEFTLVPKGKSWLGGGGGKPGEQEVQIKHDFYMGVYEVTQEEWEKVTGKNPSEFSRNGMKKDVVREIADADLKRFPVDLVTWGGCQDFIKALNEQVKETGWKYRLPTEVEWEYACRGGPMADKAESAFDFYLEKPTNTLLASQANFMDTNLKRTNKVGSYTPNRLGIYDMHGNIGEWCQDEFPAAPNVPDGTVQHALRGGSFNTPTQFRQTSFTKTYPLSFGRHCGLRLVRVPVGGAGTTTSVTPQPAHSSKLFMHDLAFPQWVKDVQAMSAERQIEAVSKKMIELNPGFDGKLAHGWLGQPVIAQGKVVEICLETGKVTTIAPLRAFGALRGVSLIGPGEHLDDLSPLRGMPMERFHSQSNYRITDVSPVAGPELRELTVTQSQVSDLSPLSGLKLRHLNLAMNPIRNIDSLAGLPSKHWDWTPGKPL